MKIRNHRVEGAEYQPARWIGEAIVPTMVIVHDTASRIGKGRVAEYLRNNTAKTSVHFVIERDGTLIQQVPTNRRANHAGRSVYHGRSGCNGFTIGIEIVNPGRMERGRPGFARTWYGEEFAIDENGIVEAESPHHPRGLWMPHTEAQITTTLDLCHALFAHLPTLRDVRAHWYVSPGRKIDIHPLMQVESIRSQVLGREEPDEDAADTSSSEVAGDAFVRIEVPGGDTLNMRRWPSFNPNVIAAIPSGVEVPVLRQGTFRGRGWVKVVYSGQEGWVVARYARKVA